MNLSLRQGIERQARQFSRRRTEGEVNRNWQLYNRSRARTATIPNAVPIMTTFKTNPYDRLLDLDKASDLKLYNKAVEGLEKEDKFDGKKANFDKFQKLIGKSFRDVKVMEALLIPTKWDVNNADPEAKKLVLMEVDAFKTNKVTEEQVAVKSELVWATTTHGANTPRYFKQLAIVPTNNAELTMARNMMQMKHIIMGKKIWDSLTSKFQIDIIGSEHKYTLNEEIDGPMLWCFIKRYCKPSTKVGAAKLKGMIEKAKISDHKGDVKAFNTWFESTRDAIIAEEGKGYNEYTRMPFQAYLTSSNAEFVIAIKEEERRWIQDKLPDYSHTNLLELGRITFDNLPDTEDWGQVEDNKKEKDDQKSFLALVTEIMSKLNNGGGGGGSANSGDKDKKYVAPGDRTYQAWRFDNPGNEKTKVVKGTTMTWCDNDCHEKIPMCCGRKNYRNRANHAKFMSERRGGEASDSNSSNGNESKMKATDDFKLALAAMVSEEDFAALQ